MATTAEATPIPRARRASVAVVGADDGAAETPRIHYQGAQVGTAAAFAKSSNGSLVVSAACRAAWDEYCKTIRHTASTAHEPEVRAFVYAFEAQGDRAAEAAREAALAKQFAAGRQEGYEAARELVRNRVVAPLGMTIAAGRRGDLAGYCDTLTEALRVRLELEGRAAPAAPPADPLASLPPPIKGAVETLVLELGIVVEERDGAQRDAARYRQVREMLRDG